MKFNKPVVTSLFYLDESILNKDFFLAPLILAKKLSARFNFVYPRNKENNHYPKVYRDSNLIPITSDSEFEFSIWKERHTILYVVRNAKKINLLFLVWLNPRNLLLALIYKLLNGNGVCLIKGDMNPADYQLDVDRNFRKQSIKSYLKKKLYNNVDLLTCETKETFNLIKMGLFGKSMSDKVFLLPNGFDEETRIELKVEVYPFSQKENIILIVARIGDEVKNHEMILNSLSGLGIGDWKVIFVGNIEPSFKANIETFYRNNSGLSDSVIFVGPKYSKEDLWSYYNRSKVFLLTSHKEGFPNVFPEALRFGCFIITTCVSSSADVTDNGRVGKIIDINSDYQLRDFLTKEVFTNKIDFQTAYNESIKLCKENFLWDKNIERLSDTPALKKLNYAK